jgi:hypothetical protein
MIERGPQAAMVVVLKRHEAERLKHAVGHLSCGHEDFRHTVYWALLGLKRDFDEVALAQRAGQVQEPAGYGNGLEFAFSAAAIF